MFGRTPVPSQATLQFAGQLLEHALLRRGVYDRVARWPGRLRTPQRRGEEAPNTGTSDPERDSHGFLEQGEAGGTRIPLP
jgi:hypothetical protein